MAIRPEVSRLREQVARLELIQEINLQFSSNLDFDSLLKNFFEKVIEALKAEAGSFWIYDDKTRKIKCRDAHGPAKDKVIGLELACGEGIVGWCVENLESTIVLDAQKDERFYAKADSEADFVTHSMICVPLVVNEEPLGAIQIINKKGRAGSKFDENDQHVIEALCTSGAIAIKNARLMQSEKKVKELKTMLDLSREITSTLDMDHVLYTVVNLTSQVIDFDRGVIALYEDDEGKNAQLAAESGKEKIEVNSPINVALKKFLEATGNERELYIPNKSEYMSKKTKMQEAVKEYLQETKALSIYSKVLADSEGKLGVLFLESRQPNLIGSGQKEILAILGNQTTVAIRNASLYKNVPSLTSDSVAKTFKSWKTLVAALLIVFVACSGYIPMRHTATVDVEIVGEKRTPVYTEVADIIEEVLVEENQSVKKGQVLVRLRSIDQELRLKQLQSDLALKRQEWANSSLKGDEDKLAALELEIDNLQHDLESTEKDLRARTILSPVSGLVITSDLYQLEGTQIGQGERMLEIDNSPGRRIEAYALERDVIHIKEGQKVRFILRAFPDRRDYEAKVSAIAPTSEEHNGEITYRLEVGDVLGPSEGLKFGMTGKGKVIIGNSSVYRVLLAPWVATLRNWFIL